MFMVKQKDTMSYREDKDIWIEKVPVPITSKGGSRGWPSQGLEHEIKSIRKYIII